jgi:fatty acid desaturase
LNSDTSVPAGCVSNISPRERKKRLISGLLAFLFALAILILLLVLGADRWWRLLLFFPFWGATIGFFQWRDKT